MHSCDKLECLTLTNITILIHSLKLSQVVQLRYMVCRLGGIDIGLEQAPLVFFILFFPSFEHVKSMLIMGTNNTKNSS
jgi:hypothetical protein